MYHPIVVASNNDLTCSNGAIRPIGKKNDLEISPTSKHHNNAATRVLASTTVRDTIAYIHSADPSFPFGRGRQQYSAF